MKTLKFKLLTVLMLAILSISITALPVFAATDAPASTATQEESEPLPEENTEESETADPNSIAGVITETYEDVKGEVGIVFLQVIVNAFRVILGIGFFTVICFAFRNKHNGEGIHWIPIVVFGILFAVSIFLPGRIWNIV